MHSRASPRRASFKSDTASANEKRGRDVTEKEVKAFEEAVCKCSKRNSRRDVCKCSSTAQTHTPRPWYHSEQDRNGTVISTTTIEYRLQLRVYMIVDARAHA
ncbi:hypothetical protein MRX96_029248 [Rhipicephalus microplus]